MSLRRTKYEYEETVKLIALLRKKKNKLKKQIFREEFKKKHGISPETFYRRKK